jgi:anti-sigma-K factor RskA
MTREEATELIPLYAVGALDADEVRAVDDFLRDASPEERREMTEWREIASMLPLALPEVDPPKSLRARLLNRIAASPATSETAETTAKVLPFVRPARRIEPRTERWLLMAASLLLACASAYLFWQNSQLRDDRDRISADLETKQREYDAILSSTTRVVAMAGDEAPQANAKVIWDTKNQVWKIFIFDLPMPPSDKDYQLWYVTKDHKISAAVFSPDAKGQTILTLTLPPQALNGLAATAVTLEPKGGSPQPTGKFYLKAAI